MIDELSLWREAMGDPAREPATVAVGASADVGNFHFETRKTTMPNVIGMLDGRLKGPKSRTGKPVKGATFATTSQRNVYDQAMKTGRWAA